MRHFVQIPAGPRKHIHCLIAALLAAVLHHAGIANAAPDAPKPASLQARLLSPCDVPGVSRKGRCGVFQVAENPEKPAGRQLPIHVVVIPAADGHALPDPIVPLMGGPGEDTISGAAMYAEQFAPLLRERDLVLIDQRGTGKSGALQCDLYSADDPGASLRDFFPPATVEKCARQLGTQADLTQYTYLHFARDLEHIRRELGYASLNLFSASYGTRAAQVFIRTYPKSVRTVYLGSVVPIDVPTPLTFAKTEESVIVRTFSACTADPACNAAFPNLQDEFRQVLARLDAGTVRVPASGSDGTAVLTRGRFVEWLRSLLYRPSSAAAVPWMIHQAYTGNWNPITENILKGARERDSAFSFGLFFAITCNEDVSFVREQDVAAATQNTALGDYRLRQQQAACRYWPKVSLPDDYRAPLRASVPALFVSGDTDAGSPLWFTHHATPWFADRIEIVLGNRGHTEWNECVARLYGQLVRNGGIKGLDAASCTPEPRPPFKTH